MRAGRASPGRGLGGAGGLTVSSSPATMPAAMHAASTTSGKGTWAPTRPMAQAGFGRIGARASRAQAMRANTTVMAVSRGV